MSFSLNKKIFYSGLFLVVVIMAFSVFKITNDIMSFVYASANYCMSFIAYIKGAGLSKILPYLLLSILLLYAFFNSIKFLILEVLKTRKLKKWFKFRIINDINDVWLIRDDSVYALTIGFLKPIIIYTTGLKRVCNKNEIDAILIHEKSHKVNRDPLKRLFYGMVNSFFFFIPFLKQITVALSTEHEKNADKKVQSLGLQMQLDSAMKKVLCKNGILLKSGCHFNSFIERIENRNGVNININIPITSIIISIVSILGVFALTSYTHAENHFNAYNEATSISLNETPTCQSEEKSYDFMSYKSIIK